MVVDDSVVVRGLVSRWIAETPGMMVASVHRTGSDAVRSILTSNPDVIVLDIEMPDMDGITALPLLLKQRSHTAIIMSSTLTLKNADVSLRCLSMGAADYLPKPSTNSGISISGDFRRDLLEKLLTLGQRVRQGFAPPSRAVAPPALAKPAIALRPLQRVRPQLLLIGASTGGPQAVMALLRGLGRAVDHLAIVVAQHMPPAFTAMFADHLSRNLGIHAAEAQDDEPFLRGRVYVATGGRHLLVQRRGGLLRAILDDGPALHFCRPSVDMLFGSAATVAGPGSLAIVLTGMGADGAIGATQLARAGGQVLAQDEASSVVWGMPGSAARTGMCSAVLPIEGLANTVIGLMRASPSP